jgi:hypothetical protein
VLAARASRSFGSCRRVVGLHRMLELCGKAIRKPPHVVAHRVLAEGRVLWESYSLPRRGSGLTLSDVLKDVGVPSAKALRSHVAARPYVARFDELQLAMLDAVDHEESVRLRTRAEAGLKHEVDLLGSGPVTLGAAIDWHSDYKSGRRWEPGFFGHITYGEPGGHGDVKVPWEVSRMQWLIPAAQMYALTRDERYAAGVRDVLDHWIAENPYGSTVNWTCTMEVALRIVTWTFFYRALHESAAWQDGTFQERFLLSLYEHGAFTAGHLERSDVNGNHYTADAAGLVFAGLFFGGSGKSRMWHSRGWRILEDELPKQVSPDGVDFEGSVPYHRFVAELFLLPALYRQRQGLPVAEPYKKRVIAMARFAESYSPCHGLAPVVGDADDARALPLGTQPTNDHRHLIGCVGVEWEVPDLVADCSGPRAEVAWLCGAKRAMTLPSRVEAPELRSQGFRLAGYYTMRSARSHVFIDCAPVGQAGRGGHGHNDCLAFTATLEGCPIVVDAGSYLYTGSYEERNHFRSTGVHNTPLVGDEELNRFVSPAHLWTLHYDAVPSVRRWEIRDDIDCFVGAHDGYQRLENPVRPIRTIVLEKGTSSLLVSDIIEGKGDYVTQIPWHLHPEVRVREVGDEHLEIEAAGAHFSVLWEGQGWSASIEPARIAPSYGVVEDSLRIVWRHGGPVGARLNCMLCPTTDLLAARARLAALIRHGEVS